MSTAIASTLAAKIEGPILPATFRDLRAVFACLSAALKDQPFLLGGDYPAVDLLFVQPLRLDARRPSRRRCRPGMARTRRGASGAPDSGRA
mgnify:CR=1 FL=1